MAVKHGFEAALANETGAMPGERDRYSTRVSAFRARDKTHHHFDALLKKRLSTALNFNAPTKKQHRDDARCATRHASVAGRSRCDFLDDYG
jgi:hypothetical protein